MKPEKLIPPAVAILAIIAAIIFLFALVPPKPLSKENSIAPDVAANRDGDTAKGGGVTGPVGDVDTEEITTPDSESADEPDDAGPGETVVEDEPDSESETLVLATFRNSRTNGTIRNYRILRYNCETGTTYVNHVNLEIDEDACKMRVPPDVEIQLTFMRDSWSLPILRWDSEPFVVAEGETKRLDVSLESKVGCTIKGTVTDAETALPIGEGEISVYFKTMKNGRTDEDYTRIKVNPDGSFAEELWPGEFIIRTDIPDYCRFKAEPFTLADGETKELEFTLERRPEEEGSDPGEDEPEEDHLKEAVITGVVTDELSGKPLPGVEIFWQAEKQDEFDSAYIETGPDGSYRIDLPANWKISLEFREKDYRKKSIDDSKLNYGETLQLDVALMPEWKAVTEELKTCTIECIFTNSETGKLLKQVTVNVINLDYNFWSYKRSDKNGRCIFKSVPGNHKIELGSDGYAMFVREFEVSDGERRTLEIALTPIDNDLTGTITDAATGEPISGVLIYITGALEGVTGKNGFFRIPLSSSEYHLYFEVEGYEDNGVEVDISHGAPPPLEIKLRKLDALLKVEVRDIYTQQLIKCGPVYVSESSQGPGDWVDQLRLKQCDGGVFEAKTMAGANRIEVHADGYAVEYLEVTLSPGETRTVVVYLEQYTSKIYGSITDAATGESVAPGGLRLYLKGTGEESVWENGRYSIETFGDTYVLVVEANGYYAWKNKVVVPEGKGIELNIKLMPIVNDATLTGQVVNATTRAPLENADISVYCQHSTIGHLSTDRNGRFTIDVPVDHDINIHVYCKYEENWFKEVLTLQLAPGETRGIVIELYPEDEED